MKWVIGLRNIKTGIAICVCLIVSALLHLEYPFYAAIATIISMENSITNSFTAGKHRTMGTMVGAIVGASFAFIEPGNAVYCAIGVMVVIYLCNLLHWKKSVSIGCIVFLAIMLNLQNGESPMSYGLNRIIDTVIGIVVAVIVNYAVFPPRHEVKLHKARKALAKRMAQIFEEMAELGEEADLKGLRAELNSLEKYYELCRDEFHLKKDISETMDQIGDEIESYRHIYEHLIILRRLVDEHHLELKGINFEDVDDSNTEPLAGKVHSQDQDQDHVGIVYNYHVNWIYKELQKLGLPVPLHIRQFGHNVSRA
ncbi:FUSC family protein [Paenibacillus caui]|uniref:FUSC family protein n=1 Tax=Paenibacillus caui TaxID=2873927 RepID=UPI001CA8DFAE|nr:aromatic acid exporter family protein [Paenibacillus caui]